MLSWTSRWPDPRLLSSCLLCHVEGGGGGGSAPLSQALRSLHQAPELSSSLPRREPSTCTSTQASLTTPARRHTAFLSVGCLGSPKGGHRAVKSLGRQASGLEEDEGGETD